jgi:dihydrofolate synthase/folylpolyglutamate synthase
VRADSSARAAEPAAILAASRGQNASAENLTDALSLAVAQAGEDGVVCIAGSLYLAGRVKTLWDA